MSINYDERHYLLIKLLEYLKIYAHRGNIGSLFKGENGYDNSEKNVIEVLKRDYIHGIELDARYTKDGKLVAIHDDFLGFISKSNLKVSETNLEDLKKITVHDSYLKELVKISRNLFYGSSLKYLKIMRDKLSQSGPILELDEIFKKVDTDKTWIIDLKTESSAAAKELVEIIKSNKEKEIEVQSYDAMDLLTIKKASEKNKTSLLVNCGQLLRLRKSYVIDHDYVDNFSVMFSYLIRGVIKTLSIEGKGTRTWTIDSPFHYKIIINEFLAAIKSGSNISEIGIITNIPEQITQYLQKDIENCYMHMGNKVEDILPISEKQKQLQYTVNNRYRENK